jgi:imidazolonepropionase-like amidohydrolase
MRRILVLVSVFLALTTLGAQAPPTLSPEVKAFVTVDAPVFALTHVRVIDGTGAPAREDQTIIISGGKIQVLGDASATPVPAGAKVMEMHDYTAIPGIVGMHDHIFYPAGAGHYNTLSYSAPRLYLACGVTTIRTTGSIEPFTEISLKKAINQGKVPGPKVHVTSPYLEGEGAFILQMHELTGPEDARKLVQYWADQGVDDFKVYTKITRAELAAAIEEVHKRGMKISGHLCSIGFREAAAMGIDNLEHGLLVDTEFAPGKKPDTCPQGREAMEMLLKLKMSDPQIQEMIQDLVAHKVAVTSTLPVFETSVPGRPPLQPRILNAMTPEARISYLTTRARVGESKDSPALAFLKKEMEFEREFVKAGGLLIAGPDPTGYGGVVAGFGDQREVQLLVEAGFTPLEAIKIATHNGALYLGELDRIGTLAPGKQADMVLIKGNPAVNIADIEKIETVFKDGIGYDSLKLIEAARDCVGIR